MAAGCRGATTGSGQGLTQGQGGAAATDGAIFAKGAGIVAVALASVNIFGGFLVTQRMLAMYKKKEKPAPKAEA